MFWSDICVKLNGNISKFVYEFVWTLPKLFALRRIVKHSPNTALWRNPRALPPKLAALWRTGVSPHRNVCTVSRLPCTVPYYRNRLHYYWTSCDISKIDHKKVYDEQGFLPAEMLALFLDYCALCRIVEIVCTIAELGAIFLKSTVKRCM